MFRACGAVQTGAIRAEYRSARAGPLLRGHGVGVRIGGAMWRVELNSTLWRAVPGSGCAYSRNRCLARLAQSTQTAGKTGDHGERGQAQ